MFLLRVIFIFFKHLHQKLKSLTKNKTRFDEGFIMPIIGSTVLLNGQTT